MAHTTTTTTDHLLTPQRVDQLVIEHYDPAGYVRYPADLITRLGVLSDEGAAALAARAAELLERGLSLIVTPSHPDVQSFADAIDEHDQQVQALTSEITRRLDARREQIRAIWSALPHVDATRTPTAGPYLGHQQWLAHVDAALDTTTMRADRRASIRAVAAAIASTARTSGIWLAGAVDVADAADIHPRTWTRASSWLHEAGLLATLHEHRPLTLLERALAIGADRPGVRRWRAVVQLQHDEAIQRPVFAKCPPPSRRLGKAFKDLYRDISTSVPLVDNRATRGSSAAPSSRPSTRKKGVRRWRRFDPLAAVLLTRLQRLSPTFKDAKTCSVLPHLGKFAQRDVEPTALIVAINDLHQRHGLRPSAGSLDPTRRAVWALTRLSPDDVVMLEHYNVYAPSGLDVMSPLIGASLGVEAGGAW